MKNLFKSFLLFVCLLSLANCRRNGPMGGGMMDGAGPCRRCNNLARNPNNLNFNRQTNPNLLAPFPNGNGGNLGALDFDDTQGSISGPVEQEDLSAPVGQHFSSGQVIQPTHQ